jgi:hypothetical protein
VKRITHHVSRITHHSSHYFDRQSFTPAILLVGETLRGPPRDAITFRIKDARGSLELFIADADPHASVAFDILYPLRSAKVFGEDIQLALRFHEPNLYFSRLAAGSADGCQVKVL